MKHTKRVLSAIIVLLFATLPTVAQGLSARIDTLLQESLLRDSDVSIAVYDLDDDTLLYTHREKKLCRPASILKVATATIALYRLGSDYAVSTRLYEKSNSDGYRNLYVRGEIDPLFSQEELIELISPIAAGTTIDTLYADCSFSDSIYWGPGWSWDDTPWSFQPYISPLMFNGGYVKVTATPAKRGTPPTVECCPESSFYTIVNEAVSRGDKGEKLTILRDWLDNSNVIRLRGDCNAPKSEKMNLYRSQDFFMAVMREQLAKQGVNVANIAFAKTPTDAREVHHIERDIKDIVKEALMESNNLCAEALSYHLGTLFGKTPVKQEDGPEVIKSFIEYNLDINNEFNIADGSGLSPYNYLSAEIFIDILRKAYSNDEIYNIIKSSLPVAGVSGTMKQRGKGTIIQNKIYAKTGTMKGVTTLAGFAYPSNGHTLAFVIMNQNGLCAKSVRQWQDRVCETLCR